MLPIDPYHQGSLDGLCGIYAVINAVRLLFPGLEEAAARDLFTHAVRLLEDRPLTLDIVHAGIGDRDLRRLVVECGTYLLDEHELVVTLGRIPVGKRVSVQAIWSGLAAELASPAAAIVGMTGRERHWTVAYRVTSRTLWLADSSGMQQLARSRCTVSDTEGRYRLDPSAIFVLRRGRQQRRPRRRRNGGW